MRGGLCNLALLLALALPAAAEEVVIAALGDSLTQGYGLPERDGFVPRMQAWLDARGHDVRLINAGVSGDTTAGGAARAGWTLTPEVDGMIVALGGNDFLRGIDPATSRANLDAILGAADEAGVETLVVGLVASPNYGPDWKAAFDAMYPDLARAHGDLLHPRWFGALIEAAGGGSPQDLRPYMQPDGIHPNAEGVALIVEDIGPSVERLIDRIEADGA
ncbi:acyl-CoA thioesterase-1 [Hasllibacter halocynthiae]|uniref:Acyl-CoA thioesterase-1 n=1 Tax=Hasllibacter halocynthiae TaxID=595589 RepID=A0A2T0X185_9RHOB|nr:acyl-CoA thioesterase-1 [Hasllibacter halocynthiae]